MTDERCCRVRQCGAPAEVTDGSLAAECFAKLPSGSIQPEGWLKRQMQIALEGLPGKLWQYGEYLAENNEWLNPDISSHNDFIRGWEEVPYWLRAFVPLAIALQDEKSLQLVARYMENMYHSRQPNGWFGPRSLLHIAPPPGETDELVDLWPHMVMGEAVWNWYEYTHDRRFLDLLRDFYHFCLTLSEIQFIPSLKLPCFQLDNPWFLNGGWLASVQGLRACDMLPVLFRVYEVYKDPALLTLARRCYQHWCGPASEFLHQHNVNFAQALGYQTIYSRLKHAPYLRNAAQYWYNQHMAVWGTVRGAFAADENCRSGCTDPRYAIESCGMVESVRTFSLLGTLSGESVWGDRAEDMLFNHYPAAYTDDMKEVHYLTAPNQVQLDDYESHNVCNVSHMFAYSHTGYRCCLHNAGLGWPLYGEYLMMKSQDDGFCMWHYAPCTIHTFVGKENTPVTWHCETDYPFRNRVKLTLNLPNSVDFPLYLRIPGWCSQPQLALNGTPRDFSGDAHDRFLLMQREWRDSDSVEIVLPSEIELCENPRNGGISVNKGPFAYSLQIPEIRRKVVSNGKGAQYHKEIWDEKDTQPGAVWTELWPGKDWNYGLMPEKGFRFQEVPLPDGTPFRWDMPATKIFATGKKIPQWQLQDHMCAPLQESPVSSDEAEETLVLIPLGCARLRLSCFPVISDSERAEAWQPVPPHTPVNERAEIRYATQQRKKHVKN